MIRRRLTRTLPKPIVKKKPPKKMTRKDGICHLKIHSCGWDVRIENYKEISSIVLQAIPNLSLWSYEALRKLYIGLHELTYDFCKEKRKCVSGSVKAQYSRVLNRGIPSFIPNDRLNMLYQMYDMILTTEGHSRLRGYGFTNRFGDGLKGNPEFHRMSKVYYD